MTLPPWLLLLLLLALTLALGYQLACRRYGFRRALVYWMLVFISLALAEAGAESLGWNVTRLGDLRLLPDLAGAGTLLSVFWFLGI